METPKAFQEEVPAMAQEMARGIISKLGTRSLK
jgi:hypothetical protein